MAFKMGGQFLLTLHRMFKRLRTRDFLTLARIILRPVLIILALYIARVTADPIGPVLHSYIGMHAEQRGGELGEPRLRTPQ